MRYGRGTYKKASNPDKTPEDIQLRFALQSWETGISYYELSTRTSYDDWQKIKDYFTFINGNSREWEEEEVEGLYGWYTTAPKKVEELLHVKPDNTIEAQRERARIAQEERDAKEKAYQEKMQKISSFFEGAEYPQEEDSIILEGERIEHPRHPQNIYGGGEWWVIQKEWIWNVQNNGMDGDNWAYNNIRTGGAGAIGHRVPYNEELAELIRSFK